MAGDSDVRCCAVLLPLEVCDVALHVRELLRE